MRRTVRSSALLLVCVMTACSSDGASSGDMAAVRARSHAYFDALSSGDPAAATELRVTEMVQMAPGSPPLIGAAEIEANFGGVLIANDHSVTASINDLQLSGDIAVVRATFEQSVTPKSGGDTRVRTGSWLLVWQREEDGLWRMATETWTFHPIE